MSVTIIHTLKHKQSSFNPDANTLEILILWQLRRTVPILPKDTKSVSTLTVVVSPDHVSTISSTSAMKTTPDKREHDRDAPEPVAEGDIHRNTLLISYAAHV
jgi:hypothetical protein